METKGRFAPSPSGRMHLGNVYAALMSWLSARKKNGSWIIRIEDLDRQRCKRQYAQALLQDLSWLSLTSDEEICYQSDRDAFYLGAFNRLQEAGLIYPCFCRRQDILASSAPHASDGLVIYQGRCRSLSPEEQTRLSQIRKPASRIRLPDAASSFTDGHYGLQEANLARDCGDFIIRRSDGNFSYQLAVAVDDAAMGVTEVVRGRDLLMSTHQQLFLYRSLASTPPTFSHLPLLVNQEGKRLSKRDKDGDMGLLRSRYSPQALIGLVMQLAGFIPRPEPLSLSEALSIFSWDKLPRNDLTCSDSL